MQDAPIDLATCYPEVEGHEELVRRHIRAALDDLSRDHARNTTPGERHADEAVIGAALGHQGPAGSLTLTSNGQGALATAILVARQTAGNRFAVEEWTFPHAMRLLRQFGADVTVLPMDASGLLPEALEEAGRAGVRVLYAMPTMHNPLGVTMPASRRAQVAGLTARFDMTIIEDDAYAFLDGGAPAPLQSLVPDRTLRVLSLSKILSLALRLGALVHPSPLRPLVTMQLRSLGLIANPVMASAAAELAAMGAMEALIARKRQEGAARQALARSILGPAFDTCDAAWYGMLHVPVAGSGFVAQARGAGLAVTPAGDFRPGGDDRRQVRVSLGGETSRARLAEGFSRLATLMRSPTQHGSCCRAARDVVSRGVGQARNLRSCTKRSACSPPAFPACLVAPPSRRRDGPSRGSTR